MKIRIFSLVFCLALFSFGAKAQITTTTTYNLGDIKSNKNFSKSTITSSQCPAFLALNVPAGRYITSIDVFYDFDAGANSIYEQWSYLECITTGIKEANISDTFSLQQGVHSYSRTNLKIANGVVPAGGTQFKLHAFRITSNSGCNYSHKILNHTWVIKATHVPLPSCLPSTFLNVSNMTSQYAELSWTPGGANNWQVEYGPKGFALGTGTKVGVSTTPFLALSHNFNSTFDFYVRDSCGPGDLSFWHGPVSDSAGCHLIYAPLKEDFEGVGWIPKTPNGYGKISNCWSRTTNGYSWTTGRGRTIQVNTGPYSDHTSGNGKYIYSESVIGDSAIITSPLIDLNGLTSPELRFWHHSYGKDIIKLAVFINDGNSWSRIQIIPGENQVSSKDSWKQKFVDLSAHIDDTIQLQFRAYKARLDHFADIAIDDFWIGNSKSCLNPSNVSINSKTDSSLTLSWTGGGASNWRIKYREVGSQGSSTFISTNITSHTISGLNPLTSYLFFVQDSCGTGDVSFWQGPVFDSTSCPVFVAPWSEDFEIRGWIPGVGLHNDGNEINECWFRDTTIVQQWGTGSGNTTSPQTGPSQAFRGNNYIYRESSDGRDGSADLISPNIFIPHGMINPILVFRYHMYGNDIDSLIISVNNGTGPVKMFTKLGPLVPNINYWRTDSIDLTLFGDDTIAIIFTGVSSGIMGDIAIDDIEIREKWRYCFEPINMVATNISSKSIDLSWNSSNQGFSQINYYDIQKGPPGFTLRNVFSPLTIDSLDFSTSYRFSISDSCSTGILSKQLIDTITTSPCPKPNATFNYLANALTVDFSSTTLIADSLIWYFDSTSISTDVKPKYSFPGPGTYNVKLIAFSYCGVSDTIIKPVKVCDTLKAKWTYSVLNMAGSGMQVQFDGTSSKNLSGANWDFGDGNSNTNSLIPIHTYLTQSLSYEVILAVKNSCGEFDTLASRLDQIGIEEFESLNRIVIYPNPAHTEIRIEWNFKTFNNPLFYEVYDLGGKLLMKTDLKKLEKDAGLIQINTDKLANGIYLLRLGGSNMNIRQQFVVKH